MKARALGETDVEIAAAVLAQALGETDVEIAAAVLAQHI